MASQTDVMISNLTVKVLLSTYTDEQLHAALANVCAEIESDLSSNQTVSYMHTLQEIIKSIHQKHDIKQDSHLISTLKYIDKEICTPILHQIDRTEKGRKLCDVTIGTKWFCLKLISEENVIKWAEECLKCLKTHFECLKEGLDTPETSLKPTVILEVFNFLFSQVKNENESLFYSNFLEEFEKTLSLIFSCCDSQFAAFILVDIVPRFLKLRDINGKMEFSKTLWQRVQSFYNFDYSDCQSKNVGNGYLIMCNLMEFITKEKFISTNLLDQICSTDKFWLLIRFGLAHENSLYRKQALYVLKQITSAVDVDNDSIFKSDQHFSWSNFILIVEMLEETQVHVIKPVLVKIDYLIKTSYLYPSHLDRLLTIFHRMFMHDSKFIKKWAVERFLHLNLTRENFTDSLITQFVCIPLLNVINDPALFARSQEEERCSIPVIASSLSYFFKHCSDILQDSSQAVFLFSTLLNHIQCQSWAPVPLLYLSYSLSTVSTIPVWNLSALEDLKKLIVDSLRTQEKYIKIAIHCFFFEAFLNLVKKDELTFETLSSILLPFRQYGVWSRKTNLWWLSVKWLQGSVSNGFLTPKNALKFIKQMTQELNEVSENKDKDIYFTDLTLERTSNTLLLCLDAGFFSLSNFDCVLNADVELQPIKTVLMTMNSRPYLPIGKIDHSLKFVISLLEEVQNNYQESTEDIVQIKLLQWIFPSISSVIDYIIQRISNPVKNMEDVERLKMYLKLLKLLDKMYKNVNDFDECINKMTDMSLLYFNDNSEDKLLTKYSAITCLAWITEIIEEKPNYDKWKLSTDKIICFVKHNLAKNIFIDALTKSSSNNEKNPNIHLVQRGRIISDYFNCFWTCLAFYTIRCKNELSVISLMELALHTLEIGTDVIPAVCRCIAHVLPEVLNEDEHIFEKFLQFVWNVAFERRKTDVFWIAIQSFIEATFQPQILDHPKAHILTDICEKAYALSDTCATIFHMLVFHCCKIWIRSKDKRQHICLHAKFIANALTFGPVHRKDQRVNNDADAFIFSFGKKCAVNSLAKSDFLDEVSVRAAAVSLITNLDNEHHLISELIPLLLQEDVQIGATRSRYYANSLIHLKKNRIWQTFLILEPLCSEAILIDLLNNVYSQLVEEGSQLSVRLVHEWLAVKILIRFSAPRNQLWDEIKKAAKIRVGSVGSFLNIIYHVGKLLDSLHQEEFILSGFHCILPWCMAQNFNTRVTAQVVFHKLWLICESNNFQNAIQIYGPIESSLRLSQQGGNSARCTQKILDNYYFKIFDCLKHYSLQTIFYDILRLTNVSDYEWIPPTVFTKFSTDFIHLKIYNDENELNIPEENSSKEDSEEMEETCADTVNGNIQKKITPWKRLLNEDGLLLNKNDDSSNGVLIVVASLIDKIPNLGGLCRSCEIFGAKEYIVSNIKCIEDKQFQNLSVSAEKWVSISEVKPFQLKDYLLAKRSEGYTLIGAEQTANSLQVQNYTFPKKCLLVLGNEKEGIPVSLIQLLDVCVEIPQQGVIRSLNVHVCGALLIWEYSRQNNQFNNNV